MASTARLDELKKKFDENPRRYFAPLANEHRKSGNLDQAIALCRAHLPQQPAHISGHIVLGQALFEAGQPDESRDTFHTALDLDPENLIALRCLGDIARSGGDVPTARSWYQRVLDVDPRNDEIEQLIRELDTPATLDSAESAAGVAESEAVPVVDGAQSEPHSAPAAPTADHSRFAPLTVDQIDSDSELFAPSGDAGKSSSGSQEVAGSFDNRSSWAADAPTAEIPMLDLPELDAFETSNAGAETLLQNEDSSAQPDALGHDLPLGGELVDLGDLEAAPEPMSSSASSADDTAAAASATESVTQFDASDFYLEPAPNGTADSETRDESSARTASESAGEAPHDAADDRPPAPGAPDGASTYEARDWEREPTAFSTEAPNADVPHRQAPDADIAATNFAGPTPGSMLQEDASSSAESPAAAEPVAEEVLGLEVMEFVPPPATSRRAADAPTAADPLVGHMPELTSPTAAGATPDAFVTETMAELYLQQGFTSEALAVYRELLARNPADASLRERIEQIESGSMSSIGMAMLSENVVESARKRQTERHARSVRSFFASLAGRRAPYPTHRQEPAPPASDGDAADPQALAPASDWDTDASVASLAESASQPAQPIPDEPADAAAGDVRSTAGPSAAEQMASFDPFADAWETPGTAGGDPNEHRTGGDVSRPELAYGNAAGEASTSSDVRPASARERPTPRSLQDIFPESATTPRADAAAQTLATAFGQAEPQGRPTRAASNELSLDRVFRGAPENAPQPDGGFSFDQFFSDARPTGPDATATPPASTAPEAARGADGGGDTHDIEQFTAWLEGLKKK